MFNPMTSCQLCNKSMDGDAHTKELVKVFPRYEDKIIRWRTSCCNVPCHKWCINQCRRFLLCCPLCHSSADHSLTNVECDDSEDYLLVLMKTSFFQDLYNEMMHKKRMSSHNNDITWNSWLSYKHYVELINDMLLVHSRKKRRKPTTIIDF